MPTHLPNWLARRAATYPDHTALIAGTTRLTFAELDGQASAMAQRLMALGVQPDDRVALLMGNSPVFVVLVHALMRCGAVLVPLNTRLSERELAWQLRDVAATLLLHDAPNAERAMQIAATEPALHCYAAADLAAVPAAAQPLRDTIDLDATHTIIYTSGTTGQPKGAMLSYGNHWWNATASALNLGLHADDCWLAVLPLFHVGGLSILLRSVIYAMPMVLHERFDPAAVNQALDEDGVTVVSLVSVMLQRLLDQRGDKLYPPTLRCVLLGGGPAPRPLLDACAERGIPVAQTYGMTETASQAATLAPADALRKLGSAGQPLLPLELRIATEDGNAAPNAVGEIVLRGPMVTQGYVNRPDATAVALRDGWLHTGDLGYLDHEGYLYVVDRRKDLIISGGENVYPAEVEAVLLAHPAVAEAGVVGVADAQWGQVPVAVVVQETQQNQEPRTKNHAASSASTLSPEPALELVEGVAGHAARDPALEAAIIAFCRERLAAYKVPRRVVFVASLPRTASGKLQRNLLSRDAAEE